jgi:hypothetical protein
MKMTRTETMRTRVLVCIALGILAIYAGLSVSEAHSAADRLSRAKGDLAEVAAKLTEMDRLKQAPKVAALQLESPAEIANRISAARQVANLPQSALMKEQPLDPIRIDRSDFEVRATDIDLSASTLPRIMAFCDALRDDETGTVVRDITLTEPQSVAGGANEEKWVAQLVLTQMIFSPTSR